jgi:hypothetical protein
MRRSTSPGSKAGTSRAVPPFSRVGRAATVSPTTWNSGTTTSVTSAEVISTSTIVLTQFQIMLPWERTTPLGPPVVPEVYMIMQMSSVPTGSSIGSSGCAANRSA